MRAGRSRSSRPPKASGRAQRGESAARALAARRKGLLIHIQRYPKFPLCASELLYECATYVGSFGDLLPLIESVRVVVPPYR